MASATNPRKNPTMHKQSFTSNSRFQHRELRASRDFRHYATSQAENNVTNRRRAFQIEFNTSLPPIQLFETYLQFHIYALRWRKKFGQ